MIPVTLLISGGWLKMLPIGISFLEEVITIFLFLLLCLSIKLSLVGEFSRRISNVDLELLVIGIVETSLHYLLFCFLFDLCNFGVDFPFLFLLLDFMLSILSFLCFCMSLFWIFSCNQSLRGRLSSSDNLSSLSFSCEEFGLEVILRFDLRNQNNFDLKTKSRYLFVALTHNKQGFLSTLNGGGLIMGYVCFFSLAHSF